MGLSYEGNFSLAPGITLQTEHCIIEILPSWLKLNIKFHNVLQFFIFKLVVVSSHDIDIPALWLSYPYCLNILLSILEFSIRYRLSTHCNFWNWIWKNVRRLSKIWYISVFYLIFQSPSPPAPVHWNGVHSPPPTPSPRLAENPALFLYWSALNALGVTYLSAILAERVSLHSVLSPLLN